MFFFSFVEGKKHDTGMLCDSRLVRMLEEHAYGINRQPMCIYGDPEYPFRTDLQAPFKVVQPDPEVKQKYELSLCVKWFFGDILSGKSLK